jgi:hypothetical protein
MYACLVRHVDGEGFRGRVASLLDADDPLVRLRARFVLHVAAHPAQRVKRASFQRWLG